MNIPDYIEQLPDEEWREVEGYPLYGVSNMGRIISFQRSTAKVLKTPPDSDGYSQVTLIGRNQKIHKLVWRAFVGTIEDGKEINHIDTDKSNNKLNNLEAVSKSHNVKHAYDNGLQKHVGRNTGLTPDDRNRIRSLLKDGLSCRAIGDMFGVSRTSIALIKSGKRHSKDLER